MTNTNPIVILCIFLFCFCNFAAGQIKKDSLFNLLKTVKHDTVRCRLYIEIGTEYENINLDMALLLYDKAFILATKRKNKLYQAKSLLNSGIANVSHSNYDKAIDCFNKALKIYFDISNSLDKNNIKLGKQGARDCYNNIGIVYYNHSNYFQAIEYYQKSLKISEELGDKKGMSACYANIGMAYKEQGNYILSLNYCQKSLSIFEELDDKKRMSDCYNNIGIIHACQSNYEKALKYYLKALKIKEELDDKNGMAMCYGNIGCLYHNQGSDIKVHPKSRDSLFIRALKYFLRDLKLAEELDDKNGMAACYTNIGNVHKDQGYYDKALNYYHRSLKIDEELGHKNGIVIVLGCIAGLHITLADSKATPKTEKIVHYNEAINYGLKTINLAKEINALPMVKDAAANLQQAYKAIGKPSKALEYAEIFIATNDSMFKVEKTKAIAEMETKYQTEKKELRISLLEKEKNIQLLEIQNLHEKKRNQLIILIFMIVITIVIAISIYLRNKYKEKIKFERHISDLRKSHFQEVIESQEMERKRIAGDLHDSLGQLLSTAKLNLLALENYINLNSKQKKKIYNNSLSLIDEACVEVRSISYHLMPGALIKLGLISAINELVEKIRITDMIKINLSIVGFTDRISENEEINLFRLFQELINNMIKHSKATEISITLTRNESSIYLSFTDNGEGFDIDQIKKSKGIGWENIFSRVAILNGNIDIKSEKVNGSHISIIFALSTK